MCTCVFYMSFYTHLYGCLGRPEEDIGSPGTGVTGGCEPPDLGTGNPTKVLWEKKKTLNH